MISIQALVVFASLEVVVWLIAVILFLDLRRASRRNRLVRRFRSVLLDWCVDEYSMTYR